MLDGKVAIVTGAGRGLGRAEALELARLGASVVVNDYGVDWDGTGTDDRPATQVVDEIAAAGGRAVAQYGDVADWSSAEGLVRRAVEEFGDLHIVVNNAGFVRDRMIFNMTEDEFDAVVRVHLKGHFAVSRHACAHWRQRYKEHGEAHGRLINTSSEAFLFGSPGQPNYAAAKAGIVSLTLAIAQSMIRYGVTANAICPRARTKMTEMTIPDMVAGDAFDPGNVAPLVAALASPGAARVTAQVFIVYGGQVSIMRGPSVEERVETEGRWSSPELASRLGDLYAAREPGLGYVMGAS